MSHARWLSLSLPLFVLACQGAKEPAGVARITGASEVVTGAPAAQPERMPRCPNVVAGAATIVSEVPGGVELRVVAAGDGVGEVRKRAAFLAGAAEETRGRHRGEGGGAAQFGRCPVVMRNTKLEVREIPGGAAIVVRPSDPAEVDWLRREVQARSAQLAAPKPFGPGLMKECPAAVPNAQVTVTDKPYGVDVKMTEGTAEGVRAIRERAKELAARGSGAGARASADASPGSSAGAGSGAAEERCPAIAPNATLIAVDVPGGATIAIKAKRPTEVAPVRRLVHERARAYQSPFIAR